MKLSKKSLLCLAAALGLSTAIGSLGAVAQQPIYVYLFAKVTDHVNTDMSEDRLRHILPAVERYRQAHPELRATATVLFSGAVSKALEDRNSQTHIVDFVKDYIRRGVIEPGYDGTDEPTYEKRPMLNIMNQPSPEARWQNRRAVMTQLIAEARDPLTGAPTAGTGGLKKMQEVFGTAAYIKGLEPTFATYRPPQRARVKAGEAPPGVDIKPLPGVLPEIGGDTETLQVLRSYNTQALMFGVPAQNPVQLPGYREATTHFGMFMSPAPDTAPELYWQDYVLRVSEAAPPVRAVKASDGLEALKGVLNQAKRTSIQVIEVEVGSLDNYLKADFLKTGSHPPLKYAYEHPDSPKLPADDLRPAAETDAGWSKEGDLLKWLTEQYFPANAGSRFIANKDLSKMAGASTGFEISTDHLRSELTNAINKRGSDNYLFNYLLVDGHYLSLAELFQVLVDELAEYHHSGRFPASVKTAKVYGPFRMVTGHGPNGGEVVAGDLEALCDTIDASLHQDTANPNGIPKNSILPLFQLDTFDLNPAQMIRLMALALAAPGPEAKLPVHMAYMLQEVGALVPKNRPVFDTGFVWTLKPAQLASPE